MNETTEIELAIMTARGQRVMLSGDLAALYEVPAKALRQAAKRNIEIMRAFVRLRRILGEHKELSRRIDELENRYDEQFRSVFEAIRCLMAPPDPSRNPIGFTAKISKISIKERSS